MTNGRENVDEVTYGRLPFPVERTIEQELSRLKAENERMRKALQKIAKYDCQFSQKNGCGYICDTCIAKEALSAGEEKK